MTAGSTEMSSNGPFKVPLKVSWFIGLSVNLTYNAWSFFSMHLVNYFLHHWAD